MEQVEKEDEYFMERLIEAQIGKVKREKGTENFWELCRLFT